MRKPIAAGLFGLGLVAVLLACLFTVRQLSQATPRGRVVRVGVYENSPKVYTRTDGSAAGLFIDLLRPIARKEHWQLQFVHCYWQQCLQMLDEAHIDLMPDMAYSAIRERRFDFSSTAVAHAWSEVYARESLGVHSIADLAGLRVALLKDSIQQDSFSRMMQQAGLSYTPVLLKSYEAGFLAAREGRVDAVVSNNFYNTRHPAEAPLVETPIVFQTVGLYYASASGHNDALLQAIDRYLKTWMRDPGSLYFKALRQSMTPPTITVIPAWLQLGLLAAIGLAALLVVASLVLRWQVRQRTAELARSNRHLDEVLLASPAVIYRLKHQDGQVVPDWVSPNIQRLFGFTVIQALAPDWWQRQLHSEDREKAMRAYRQLPQEGSMVHEYRIIDAWGNTRFIRDELHMSPTQGHEAHTVFGAWNDLTESRVQAQRAEFLQSHDPLTRLPNRLELARRLVRAIDQAHTRHRELALLWIDLDRFKSINESAGHSAGDAILLQVSQTLLRVVDEGDAVFRIGSDEFLVLLEREIGTHDAISMAERIQSVLSEPQSTTGQVQALSGSIGISVYPSSGEDADTLLHHAEVAMYEAKERGRNTWCLFDERLSSRVMERLSMENALSGAIARGELVLHYQPQIDLASGLPVGVEALVRWAHPELGLLPPSQFIEFAEERGLIDQIGRWVLQEACRQMVEWRRSGLDIAQISVNLSVRQIERAGVIAHVKEVLAGSGLQASRLELELTESSIMRDPEKAVQTLAALKKLGVKLSIDDFGTGHSSLAYLKQLPLDQLKIDHAFVRDIGVSANDEAICRAVIELARQLGLTTVAEGVEREAQAAFLRREGCNVAQGYVYCKPLPATALAEYWSHHGAVSRNAT